RIVTPSIHPPEHTAAYVEFSLTYNARLELSWVVDSVGGEWSGWGAVNVDDNVRQEEKQRSRATIDSPNRRGCITHIEFALIEQAEKQSSNHSVSFSVAITAPTDSLSRTISSKRRYIDLLKCSEHERRRCYRLLAPSPPL